MHESNFFFFWKQLNLLKTLNQGEFTIIMWKGNNTLHIMKNYDIKKGEHIPLLHRKDKNFAPLKRMTNLEILLEPHLL